MNFKEQIEELFIKLEEERKEREKEFYGLKLIESPILKGMQVIIKSGEKAYYSPDITSGEVQVITIPAPEELSIEPPNIYFFYGTEHNGGEDIEQIFRTRSFRILG